MFAERHRPGQEVSVNVSVFELAQETGTWVCRMREGAQDSGV